MHRPLISRVELGTYMPRLDTLHRIAEALGVKVSEIVTAIDTIENSTEQPNE
jgi:transcriptional regulator with XRE-family HTH domain